MTTMRVALTDEQRALRAGVGEICKRYPGEYWRDLDRERAYPAAFVAELTRAGYLAALIPQEYGGAGLGLLEGGLILETVHRNQRLVVVLAIARKVRTQLFVGKEKFEP